MYRKHNFIGRSCELLRLRKCYEAKSGGQLVMLYGRRRIGKSYLLETFSRDIPAIFYQASHDTATNQLLQFTQAVRDSDSFAWQLPSDYCFSSWDVALQYLAEHHSISRLVVILDEFPYLVTESPELPSLIQRWWDRGGNRSSVMLVLCGSAQTFMTSLELASAPLHQRFTAKIHVGPLSYRDAALFTPALSGEDCARIFGVLGGTPLYLEQWNQELSFRQNLLDLFADPASMLIDSAELVLTSDLADSRASLRILQAIGDGKRKSSEIRDTAHVTHERLLPRLVDLSLLERRVPATEDPLRSKRSSYVIADPYFRFYFRFIARNRGAIDRHLGELVIDKQILPFIDDHMGGVFEDMARSFCYFLIADGTFEGDAVQAWASRDASKEIDVVGTRNVHDVTFVGSVKWRMQLLDDAVLSNLEAHADGFLRETTPRLLIGRNGITRRVAARPHVYGYSLTEMYGRDK